MMAADAEGEGSLRTKVVCLEVRRDGRVGTLGTADVELHKVLLLEARPRHARLQVEPLGPRRHLLGDLSVDPSEAAGELKRALIP